MNPLLITERHARLHTNRDNWFIASELDVPIWLRQMPNGQELVSM